MSKTDTILLEILSMIDVLRVATERAAVKGGDALSGALWEKEDRDIDKRITVLRSQISEGNTGKEEKATLCDMNCKLDKLDRTNELLEMIKNQNEGNIDYPVRCIDHGDGCALCSDIRCTQRVQPYKGHNKE